MRVPKTAAPAALAALLVPLAYFWLVGRYGWSDTDDGFVLGSAWRVFNGEVPYRDFIDIRPPTSAWLHSLWFALVPRDFAFAAARLGAIAQMWAYSLVAVSALARARGQAEPAVVLPLALTGFLVSGTAFTPMPWHTTDGLFFCVAGAALLVFTDRPWAVVAAGLLILAGMGAKQSFYPAAPLALAYLALERRWRSAAVLAASLVLGGAGFVAWLAGGQALAPFLAQTTARTGGGFVAAAGVSSYLDMGLPFAAGLLAAIAVSWIAARLLRRPYRRGYAALAAGAVIVVDYLGRLLDAHAWINASTLGYPHALFLVATAIGLWRAARPATRREGLAALLMLGLAWQASLSIGFPTPLLFAAPLVAVPLLAPNASSEPREEAALAWAVAGLAAVMAALAALHPYEDRDPRARHDCPLARIEPHLALIVSGPKTCAKLAEYEGLRRAFPGPFLTLPAFATAHAFDGARSPIAADWPTLAEDAGLSPRLIAEADARARYALVETAEVAEFGGDQQMPLLDHIHGTWRLVRRGAVYEVYENPRWGR